MKWIWMPREGPQTISLDDFVEGEPCRRTFLRPSDDILPGSRATWDVVGHRRFFNDTASDPVGGPRVHV